MTERPEQIRAREYLRDKGSLLPVSQIHERVGAAFAATETLLDGVTEGEARRRAIPGEWTIQEVVDHLVETHRPSIDELRDLLAGRRPAGPPIPAGLRSRDPMSRPWPDVLQKLKAVHAGALEVLAHAADGYVTDARAPLVMVINVRDADGRQTPLHWVEELDWKAYAIVFRLHALDHLNQIKKTLKAARVGA
ncbi:MAG TPA: hypothetical protein DCQ64_25705 [Candidatus Rokubacteria bacterium]|nr:MAG: hypothetical protein A2X50_02780 [Candidatus Rokubacteria bacterium GWF2_70_14]HAM58622.1 hypothetical protein [Candidatus Rokubacteria bacterium]